MAILVTGAAGFIGYFLSLRLLEAGEQVYGIDSLNSYYDVALKQGRLAQLESFEKFTFEKVDLSDRSAIATLFAQNTFSCVVNLAAQAGVRYSLENPLAYADSNLLGFINILEGCRHSGVGHLVFASSSSVYGKNKKVPFATEDQVDHPVSLYAATKKANELMAHSYSHLYDLPTTGLRFFTVYGPWGRPDMAYFKFVDAIAQNRPIDVYNHGQMKRDFTYIDDVVEGIIRVMKKPQTKVTPAEAEAQGRETTAPYKIYNIGNHSPVTLMDFIAT
ncbi:MAG: NAD-dependent epimerase/dehydratase family protein, partial [Phormidesmis sp.]